MANKGFTSQTMRTAKPAALAIVLALVVLLFWMNFEHTMRYVQPTGNIQDETDTLSSEHKKHLQEFSAALQEHFGLQFQLKVQTQPLQAVESDQQTIHLALNPETEQWLLQFPDLLRQALPRDFVAYMQNEHFQVYLAEGNWPRGLMDFAQQCWEQMLRLKSQENHDS